VLVFIIRIYHDARSPECQDLHKYVRCCEITIRANHEYAVPLA